jgi:phosphohistidine phosphatase SixA
METADLLNGNLGWGAPRVAAAALAPDSSREALWDEVRVHQASAVLVVSHEPLLSSTIAWMLGSTRVIVEFQPGTLAALAIPPSNPPLGQLLWMIQPGMLR